VDQWMTCFDSGSGSQWEWAIFHGGGIGQRNVGLAYRKNVAYPWLSD